MEVLASGTILAEGQGSSKQDAARQAASRALAILSTKDADA
jgi:dsRNA-specific ribonuclease